VAALSLVGGTAFAGGHPNEPTKAAVCKYVGKPGVDERLQTGQNPIVVDRKSWMVVGSYFQDAQGRSFVLEFLNPGDPDPDISQCPAPAGPSQVTPAAPTTTQPSCNDPNETVTPSNQAGVIWSPTGSTTLKPGESVTYTASPANGYTFPNGVQTSFSATNTFDPRTCPTPTSPPPTSPPPTSPPPTSPPPTTTPPTSPPPTTAPPTSPPPTVPTTPVSHPTPHQPANTCPSGNTWFDTNHNGKVDNGECVPTANAETGLGPNAPASASESHAGLGTWLPYEIAAFAVVGLGSLVGLRKLALRRR
jgi:hypothetical protein